MSGMREVLDSYDLELHPKKGFAEPLPWEFVSQEHDAHRVMECWGNLQKAVTKLCRNRRSIHLDKHLRRLAFRVGMERICSDFSRRSENIKVEFHHQKPKNPKPFRKRNTNYTLRLLRLTDIPNVARNAPFFNAEIPSCEMEAFATEVTEHEANAIQHHSATTEVAPAEIIVGDDPSSQDRHVRFSDSEQYLDAPLVSEVEVVEEGYGSKKRERTALERMEDLETIRSYLSEEEYLANRQEILDSI